MFPGDAQVHGAFPDTIFKGTFARRGECDACGCEARIGDPATEDLPGLPDHGNGNALAVWIQNDAAHPELPSHTNLWMNRYE